MEESESNLTFLNTPESEITRDLFYKTRENLANISYDSQGEYWNSDNRTLSLSARLRAHTGFRNITPISTEEKKIRRNFHKNKKTDIFFQFKKFIPNLPTKYTHFQVRKNFFQPSESSSEIIYSKPFGIESYNLVTKKQQTLCTLSYQDETNYEKQMICLDVMTKTNGDYLICTGFANGSVNLYTISKKEIMRVKEYKANMVPNFENYLSKVISQENSNDVMTSYVKFIQRGNKSCLMTTGNDGYIRFFDLEEMKIIIQFKSDVAVNHCDFNYTNEIIGCVGDTTNVELFDFRSTNSIMKFKSHYDYGVVLKFQPESENIFATGNQDFACKIWDYRKISQNDSTSSICEPVNYLSGYFESIGDLCFTKNKSKNEKFLIFAENADYLHIYNLKLGTIQTMSYISCFNGLVYDNKTSNIYIGVEENQRGSGILCYDMIRPPCNF